MLGDRLLVTQENGDQNIRLNYYERWGGICGHLHNKNGVLTLPTILSPIHYPCRPKHVSVFPAAPYEIWSGEKGYTPPCFAHYFLSGHLHSGSLPWQLQLVWISSLFPSSEILAAAAWQPLHRSWSLASRGISSEILRHQSQPCRALSPDLGV